MPDQELSDSYRFDPIDLEQMRLLGRLTPGQRIRVMLDARELAMGLIRGRLRRQYPHLSLREINLKVLEEIARAERKPPRP
jgi:phage terminase Nu1 subunit (DNA packaging protein)